MFPAALPGAREPSGCRTGTRCWWSTHSGVAEEDCVFVTPSEPADAIWYVTDYAPEKGFIAFVRVTPGLTATRLAIQVAAAPAGATAAITFTHTSLGEKGDAFVDGFTEAAYVAFMQLWEKRMNHYLTTGSASPHEAAVRSLLSREACGRSWSQGASRQRAARKSISALTLAGGWRPPG